MEALRRKHRRLYGDAAEMKVVTEWLGIKLPPLPPDHVWVIYSAEPAVCHKDNANLNLFDEECRGWITERESHSTEPSTFVVDMHVGAGGTMRNIAHAGGIPTIEEALALLAQWFWLGMTE